MSDFLNQYSGILSVIALVLTIPLSVLANLLTPKIQTWNALRSVKSLEKRISDLKLDIVLAERMNNDPSYVVIRSTFVLQIEISSAMFFILAFVSSIASSILKETSSVVYLILGAGFYVTYFLLSNMSRRENAKITDPIRNFPEWKEKKLKQIEVFETKLSQQLIKEKAES